MNAPISDNKSKPAAESTMSPRDAAVLGMRLGPYTLFEPIGRGGMAELYLARVETELGATRLAVVKLILPAFAEDPRFSEMLIHEAKLAARLNHRHIVQVLDLGRKEERGDGHLYIAMEYVEGFDLNGLLRQCTEKNEGLPAEYALGIVSDILEGLDYAHRRLDDKGAPLGIVHRDVSPSNILISYEGEVKLCDFGIAHANDLVASNDKTEALKGKAGYMSPEHARAETLDARADVFAAGIILWELLSGRRLYRPRGDVPLLEQARRAEIPPIPDKGLPQHDELQRIVSRALAPKVEDRYPTTGAFQRDLESYLASAGLLASRLKLGEWLKSTFGTAVIEMRRASERALPKSVPPPRSSSGKSVPPARSSRVPAAPRLPSELRGKDSDAIMITLEESSPLWPAGAPVPTPAESSLAGIAMENPPSSAAPKNNMSKNGAETDKSDRQASSPPATDAELISWARKRGVVTFFFFCSCALVVAVIYALTR